MIAHIYLDPALSRITLETFRDPVQFATINDNLAIKTQDAEEEHAVIWLLTSAALTENAQLMHNWLQKYPQHRSRIIVLGDHEISESRFLPLNEEQVNLHLPLGIPMAQVRKACETQINALHAEYDLSLIHI